MQFSAHGSFGELLQGRAQLPGTVQPQDFLFTLPIQLYSNAGLELNSKTQNLQIHPKDKSKLIQLLQLFAAHYSIDLSNNINTIIRIESDIPHGKGLAGSSADLHALLQALSYLFEKNITPIEAYRLLCQIEPSDAIIHPQITACLHKDGKVLKQYTFLPELTIVALDEGNEIDTLTYNSQLEFSTNELEEYKKLFIKLDQALATQDLTKIGQIATKSVLMNQQRNFKTHLQDLCKIADKHTALGVATAHSGSMSGVLVPSEQTRKIQTVIDEIRKHGHEPLIFKTISA